MSAESMQGCSHLHVAGLGHLVEQLEGLLLEGVIGVFEAVDDSQLVFHSVLGIYAHYARQRVNAHISQVVAGGFEEAGHHLRSCTPVIYLWHVLRENKQQLCFPNTQTADEASYEISWQQGDV